MLKLGDRIGFWFMRLAVFLVFGEVLRDA